MLLKEYIKQILNKQIIAEAITKNTTHKQHIKSLFEQFINKFSALYIDYRKQNYPNAWTIKNILYAEDYQQQHIKLLFKEVSYKGYTLLFEHEGSIYVVNDRALPLLGALALTFALTLALALALSYWHEHNYLFKLSISEFQTALDVADNYDEFIVLCEQMNKEYKKEE